MKNIYKLKSKSFHSSGMLPKSLFVFMALLGASLIWFIKWQFPTSNLLSILIPVGFIFTYCSLAWKTRLFYIREDQIGDNAYYLGFLYTLSSLAYALLRFQQSNGNSDPADIIGSFGVALWSTIVGIALRVFFSQMRQDPQDIEKESRAKIAHAASVLSSDLYQASVTFNTYTRGLQQSVEEAFLQMKTATERTVESINDISKKAESMESPASVINRKVEGIFAEMDSSANKLNTLASSQTKSIEALAKSAETLAINVQSLNEKISQMKTGASSIHEDAEKVNSVINVVTSLKDELGKLSAGLSDLNSHQTKVVQGISVHADALGEQLERSRKYTEQTHESLASMTKTLANKLQ